jgi:hypothetical protein
MWGLCDSDDADVRFDCGSFNEGRQSRSKRFWEFPTVTLEMALGVPNDNELQGFRGHDRHGTRYALCSTDKGMSWKY